MKKNQIQGIDQPVSEICLGTMTFGEQNNQKESHEILDSAFEKGINFYDTAEMYPIPPSASTFNETERILGNWPAFHQHREKIVMASKVIGPTSFMSWIRNGSPKLDKENINKAIEGSLKRLKTDYIDLYQIHWPARQTNYFGQLDFQTPRDESITPIKETLDVLATLINNGKIKSIGLSNETPWGIMSFIQTAKEYNLPLVVSVQNPYSLLNRSFEIGCAEICHRENISLLSYSPMGFGVLSGKYLTGTDTPNCRLNRFPQYSRYSNPIAQKATKKYLELSKEFGLSLTELSLKFCTTRPFMGSTIIGATNNAQLEENIATTTIDFNEEIQQEINKIHQEYPNPSP